MSKIIEILGKVINDNEQEIEAWFTQQYAQNPALFYSSVDLRHSGDKLVPVDTNIFPAGFNLLADMAIENAVKNVRIYLKNNLPKAKKVLLVPENHTRNLNYLENIARIKTILEQSGLEVRIGGLSVENDAIELESASGTELIIEPIKRTNNTLCINDFTPDFILVNNDLSSGAPEILTDITQPVIPPVGMGWYRRRKTSHFDSYQNIARSFATKFGFDPWLISSSFNKCGTINFKEKKGLECVARNVEKTLHKIRKKYEEYNITETPYVFIKADSGTYGMGIMTVSSAEEVFEINKKSRKKMNAIKEGVINDEVIIQEGIPTIDKVGGKVAEPMIYMINATPIGCTMRINEERDNKGNLNSSGMSFKSACAADNEASQEGSQPACPVLNLISRLASLAASHECYEENWEI